MAKNIFRPMEIQNLMQKVTIEPPVFERPEDIEELEEIEEVEEYSGPTADDLRQEAEEFKTQWEEEKTQMIAIAKDEAEAIKKEAEETGFRSAQVTIDDAQLQANSITDEANATLAEAKAEAERLVAEAKIEVEKIKTDAHNAGYTAGREEGYTEGREEVERLVGRVHKILNATIDKRREIIMEAENQMVELVLLIAKKVVKVISENQKNVVINNVVQALRKMKSRGEVAIHVNLEDLKLTTDHINDFMEMIESVSAITVLEDSTIEKGGCLIETNLGRIDARISSQLREIEDKIKTLIPIQSVTDKKRVEDFDDI